MKHHHLEASVPLPTQPTRKHTLWLVLAATCAFLTATASGHFHSPRPRVRIAEITHVGYYDRAHRQTKYLGIPYAQPPLGNLRFHPPRAYNLSHTVIADAFGPACPQSTPVPYPVSESCLTLNIWIPDVPAPVKRSLWSEIQNGLPVLVWICKSNGGGFINGSTLNYPADGLVEAAMDLGKPVIVASMNYRLGMFGFPVGAESAASDARNLGLLDQRLALEWIHSHIALFGGDPKKITLFGESAGSMSVGAQMAYRGGNTGGIFRAAIMQSGAPSTMSASILSPRTRQETYDGIAQYLGCPVSGGSFECVRSADTMDLQRAEWNVLEMPSSLRATYPFPAAFGYNIYPDDPFFFDAPDSIVENHQFGNVPLIIGATLDEGTHFVPPLSDTTALESYFTTTRPGFTAGLETSASRTAFDTFMSMYPDDPAAGSPFGTGNETWGRGNQTKRGAAMFGDWLFEAPRRKFTREAVKAGLPVWSYQLSQPGFWPPAFGVGHFADVPLIFRWSNNRTTPQMVQFSDLVLSYWLNFAYYLDPNSKGGNLPEWPQYGSDALSLQLKIQNCTVIEDDFRAESIEWLIKEKELYI
ncbi:carboxylesterase [Rhizoctonia solani AG-3 Rhs1AP]|uniref:Carboxylic ester hydrolase n=1 Tax=Rhizoctonia solani AG-3 Rhs1AP TaxID=1086054 RepID=X8JMQ2_9AGAM|nr:carboxylesterase [Rhizoctonia solani AG-3 Rhs1AP]